MIFVNMIKYVETRQCILQIKHIDTSIYIETYRCVLLRVTSIRLYSLK